jgi:D-alanyl-D-alanine dipeptidase
MKNIFNVIFKRSASLKKISTKPQVFQKMNNIIENKSPGDLISKNSRQNYTSFKSYNVPNRPQANYFSTRPDFSKQSITFSFSSASLSSNKLKEKLQAFAGVLEKSRERIQSEIKNIEVSENLNAAFDEELNKIKQQIEFLDKNLIDLNFLNNTSIPLSSNELKEKLKILVGVLEKSRERIQPKIENLETKESLNVTFDEEFNKIKQQIEFLDKNPIDLNFLNSTCENLIHHFSEQEKIPSKIEKNVSEDLNAIRSIFKELLNDILSIIDANQINFSGTTKNCDNKNTRQSKGDGNDNKKSSTAFQLLFTALFGTGLITTVLTNLYKTSQDEANKTFDEMKKNFAEFHVKFNKFKNNAEFLSPQSRMWLLFVSVDQCKAFEADIDELQNLLKDVEYSKNKLRQMLVLSFFNDMIKKEASDIETEVKLFDYDSFLKISKKINNAIRMHQEEQENISLKEINGALDFFKNINFLDLNELLIETKSTIKTRPEEMENIPLNETKDVSSFLEKLKKLNKTKYDTLVQKYEKYLIRNKLYYNLKASALNTKGMVDRSLEKLKDSRESYKTAKEVLDERNKYIEKAIDGNHDNKIEVDHETAIVLSNLGFLHNQLANQENSTENTIIAFFYHQEANKKFPNEVAILNGLGFCFFQMKCFEDAAEAYSKALYIQKDNYIVLSNFGWLMYDMARTTKDFQKRKKYQEKSLEYFDGAIRVNAFKNKFAFYYRGILYAYMGKYDEATRDLEQVRIISNTTSVKRYAKATKTLELIRNAKLKGEKIIELDADFFEDYQEPKEMLVDVVELSKKLCTHPIEAKLKYATTKNFVGRIIHGYNPEALSVALVTPQTAQKLCELQDYLIGKYGCGLLIYDAYRPKRAVQDFEFWSKNTTATSSNYEIERKNKHFPNIGKNQLFELGYVQSSSDHCYGNTVDVFLVDVRTGKKLDMGVRYDYMDKKSHLDATKTDIGDISYENRQKLIEAMEKFGFKSISEEFWHHSYKEGTENQEALDLEINKEAAEKHGISIKK